MKNASAKCVFTNQKGEGKELNQTPVGDEELTPRTRSLETTPEDQMQTPPAENEPQPLEEPGREEGEGAITEEELISAVDQFLTEVRHGKNFDDPSIRRGIQLSQGIGGFLQQIDLEAEQAQKPLYRKDGELLLAYKKYAKEKKIPWGGLAKEFFPISTRGAVKIACSSLNIPS
jgi:hypothetical protein